MFLLLPKNNEHYRINIQAQISQSHKIMYYTVTNTSKSSHKAKSSETVEERYFATQLSLHRSIPIFSHVYPFTVSCRAALISIECLCIPSCAARLIQHFGLQLRDALLEHLRIDRHGLLLLLEGRH